MSKMHIIPDQVLEAHICRTCDKYLTVGPISIHPDGGNVCGRCRQDKKKSSTTSKATLFECDGFEPEISIPYVIFGYANHFFPCINRFEGCNDLLPFADIGKHEAHCRMKKFQCGYCRHYKGTGSQLVNHFKKLHPFSFHDQSKFRFKLKDNDLFLLKMDNFLLFLQVRIVDKHCAEFFLQSSKYIKNEMNFQCILKNVQGVGLEQVVINERRSADTIFQQIKIEQAFDFNAILCHCNLKRILNVV